MSNIVVIMEDDTGLFIRKGTRKYRPTDQQTGGLRRGRTTKAWTDNFTEQQRINVKAPEGNQVWELEETG
jgi:hypothetical protein